MEKKDWEHGISRKLIEAETLQKRIKELGEEITRDYKEKPQDLVVVCLLKGSLLFMADLIREIKLPMTLDFMEISSYGNAMETTREVKILKDLEGSVMDKNVLIVEDIIDSGLTLKKVLKILGGRGANEVALCTLLDKKVKREVEIDVQYVGFEIEDEFVLGYGLDFMQEYRNIPYIAVMGENVE